MVDAGIRSHSARRGIAGLAVASLVAGLGILGSALPASAATTYTVSGHIYGQNTAGGAAVPLEDIPVYVYDYTDTQFDAPSWFAYTDATGLFSVEVPNAGQFTYEANYSSTPQTEPYTWDYYGHTRDYWRATTFPVTEAQPSVVKDLTLSKSSTVSGTVYDENGDPAAGASVHASRPGDDNGQYTTTAGDGTYTLYGVPSGAMDLIYDLYAACYYESFQGDVVTRADAVPLDIAPGSTTSGQIAHMSRQPSITATLVDEDGNPVPWVGSVRYTKNAVTGQFEGPRSGPNGSDADGAYQQCAVAGGSYKLSFLDSLGASFQETVDRTVPFQGVWVGQSGSTSQTIETAPVIGPLADHQQVDLGTIVLHPYAGVLRSMGAPRLYVDDYPEGNTTVSADYPGFSPGLATSTRQWYFDGDAIPGATGYWYDYDPVADAGKSLVLKVTGSYDSQSVTSTSAPFVVPAETYTAAPTPTVSGEAVVGQTLHATVGTWAPTPTTQVVQWLRDGSPIADATGPDYLLTADDRAATITARVTSTKSGYGTITRTSAELGPVLGVLTTKPVTITGTAKVGVALSATTAAWGPASVPLTYTWKRGETTVGTAASYTPTSADVGASLTVTVTGTKSGYVTATRSSEPTAAVALGTLTTVTSTITGTAKVGKTLTAVHGTWGPGTVSFAYQWYDGTTAISGATAATYSVPASRSGHSLHVAITGSKAGYTSVRSSSGSVKIAAGTLTGATPTISGTAKVGSTLTAVPGTWTSGVTRTYKWSRYTGGAWTTISGATKSTYKATTTDLGKKLRVTVTGTKTGYSTLVKSSAATAAVKAG